MRLEEILDDLVINRVVSRDTAREIDTLTEGVLSNEVHINSFTEIASGTNIEKAIESIEYVLNNRMLKLSLKGCKDLINTLMDKRKRLMQASSVRMNPQLLISILNKRELFINDKLINDFTIEDIIENDKELNELFKTNISVVKLRADYEQIKGLGIDHSLSGYLSHIYVRENMIEPLGNTISFLQDKMMDNLDITIDSRSEAFLVIKYLNKEVHISAVEYVTALVAS